MMTALWSLVAIVALIMQAKVGKVLCSGPSSGSVDELATLIYSTSRRVTRRLNMGVVPYNPARTRHQIVIRAYDLELERNALCNVLRNHSARASNVASSSGADNSPWKLHLSLTWWALRCLGSPVAPPLSPDDADAMLVYSAYLNIDPTLKKLCEMAAGSL